MLDPSPIIVVYVDQFKFNGVGQFSFMYSGLINTDCVKPKVMFMLLSDCVSKQKNHSVCIMNYYSSCAGGVITVVILCVCPSDTALVARELITAVQTWYQCNQHDTSKV